MSFSFLQVVLYIFGMTNVKASASILSLVAHILSTNFDAHIRQRTSQLIPLSATIKHAKKYYLKSRKGENRRNKDKKFFL